MITISGTASEASPNGPATPLQGVTIAAYKNSDENTVVAMTTSDAQGNYSLTVPTNGAALDGFLLATDGNSYTPTYLYPPAPLTADFSNAPVIMLSSGNFSLLRGFIGGGQAGQGVIALETVDASFHPVAGASVSSTPAASKTAYDPSGGGTPSTSETATTADGRAYMFGYTPGSVTVSATATGVTFKSHSLNVHKDALTTTVITE